MLCRTRRSHRSISNRSASILAAAAASASFGSSVFAASGTWTFTSASTSWSNINAWVGTNVAGSAQDDAAVFTANIVASNGLPNNLGVTMDINVTLGSMSFTDSNTLTPGGWTLQTGGGSITLDSSTAPTITVNNLGVAADTFVGTDIRAFVAIYSPLFSSGTTGGLTKAGAGMLRLGGNNSGLFGTLNVNAGTLEIAGSPGSFTALQSLGGVNATINIGGGVFSIRSDSAVNMGSYTMNLTANSGINVDNGIGTTGNNSGNSAGAHAVGTVIMSGGGNRTLTVTGSHNATLGIGVLTTDSTNQGILINNLAPGQLIIGSVISNSAGLGGDTTLTLGGTGTTSIGGDILVNNAVNQGSVNLSVAYNDVHTLTVGSFNGVTGGLFMNGSVSRSQQTGGGSITTFAGGGTVNVLAGGLPSGSITVAVGQLNVSQAVVSSLTSTTRQLTMGGATISTGTLTPTINLNGGTLQFVAPTANVLVNTGTLANTSTTASVQTLATVTGNLDFGSTPVTFTINGTGVPTISTQMVVDGRVNGSGAITKAGRGELILRSANTLSGALTMLGGTFTGIAQASGNALSSGPVTLTSGALGVRNGTAITGSGSVPTLIFSGDSLDSARLVVDATAGGTVSLNIGTFLGRAPGTTGVLTVIPQAGSLGTNEKITVGTIDPSLTPVNGILPVYLASQVSGANTANDFLTRSGTNLITATYVGGNINTAGAAAVFQATGTTTNVLTGAATLYALKSAGQAIGGGFTLTIGNGVQPAGLILNDGASIGTTTILSLNSPEAVIWSGGTLPGTIFSPLTLAGNLTTAGAQTLNLNGLLNLNGNRTITVGSGYAVLNGTLSNGNVVKSGPGTFSLTSTNAGYTGTVTSNAGTVEITGASGDLANGTVVVNAAGYLAFNKGGASFTFSRPILGAGTVVQNSAAGTLVLNAGVPTSSFGNLDINQGRVLLTATNQLPSTVVLTNSGSAGVFDLNGKTQTIGGLNGVGTVTSSAATTFATLNVNGGGSFGGSIQDGTSSALVKLIKSSSGSLLLGSVSTFASGVTINGGTVEINGANRLGQGTLTLSGGAVLQDTTVNQSNAVFVPAGSSGTIASNGAGGETTSAVLNSNGGTLFFVKNSAGAAVWVWDGSWSAFTGTLDFSGMNGVLQFNNTVYNNGGSGSAYFNMGNNSLSFEQRQGNSTTAGTNMGALSGGPNSVLTGAGTGTGNTTTWIVGSLNLSTTFGGVLLDADANLRSVGLTKVGTGTLTLTGTSVSSGNITVNGGRVIIAGNGVLGGNGSLNQNIIVNTTGTFGFGGSGSISGSKSIIVNNGILDVTGAGAGYQNPGSVTLQGTSLQSNTGYVRGNWTQASGTISPGGGNTAGTVTFGSPADQGIVNLSGGNNLVDIQAPGSVGSGFNDLIVTNGTLNIGAGTAFRLNQLNDDIPITIGDEFPVIVYNGTLTGSLSPTISAGFRGTFSLQNHAGTGNGTLAIKIITFIDAGSANLTWTGAQSPVWDLNITSNFQENDVPATFFQQDNVVMDDSAPSGTVVLANSLLKPNVINFKNNVLPYDLSGQGAIGGSGGLLKTGTGLLTVRNQNLFIGNATINAGTVKIGVDAGGQGGFLGHNNTIYINNATLSLSNNALGRDGSNGVGTFNDAAVPAGSTATLVFNNLGAGSGNWEAPLHGSGTIYLISNGNNNGNGSINLNSDNSNATGVVNVLVDPAFPNGVINVRSNNVNFGGGMVWVLPNGPTPVANLTTQISDPWTSEVPFGGLSGNGTLTAQSGGSLSHKKRWVIGSFGQTNTWAGNIVDANGASTNSASGIIKVGTGTLVLNGTGLVYTGDTTVNAGVLVLDGTANSGGGTLGGNLQNTKRIQVNGGTFLMRNTATLSGWTRPNVTGDTTAGVVISAVGGGVIDLRQSLNYIGDFINDFSPTRFQLPVGLTLSGSDGSILAPIQLGVDPNGAAGPGNTNTTGGGTIDPGDGGLGMYGTLKFQELHVGTGGTITFDLGSTTTAGGGVNDLVQTTGDLVVSGGSLVVNLNAITPANRTFRLMTGGTMSQNGASVDNLIINGRNATGHLLTDTTNNWVKLIIDQPSVSNSINWRQQVSSPSFWIANTWDTNLSANWQNGANTADVFYPGDAVTFDTTGGGGTVILAAPVFPTSVTVNAGANLGYTFSGTTFGAAAAGASFRTQQTAGRISGTTGLTKSGIGSLVLLMDNNYSGTTNITGGTLQIGDNGIVVAGSFNRYDSAVTGSPGTGPIVISANATLSFARRDAFVIFNNISGAGALFKTNNSQMRLDGTNTYTGGTVVAGGVIRQGHDNAIPANSDVYITNSFNPTNTANSQGGQLALFGYNLTLNSILSRFDNLTTGAPGVIGSGTVGSITGGGTVGSTLTIGSANFAAAMTGSLSLIKNTSAVATMSYQGSSYTGPTFINAGTLQVIVGPGTGIHNSAATGTYTIASGAALAGNGTINAPILPVAGSIIAPGIFGGTTAQQVGTLALGTGIFNGGLVMNMDLNVGSLDQIRFNNANGLNTNSFFTLNGVSTFNINNITPGGIVNANTYDLLDYSGTVALPDLSHFSLGTITGFGAAYSLALINNIGSTEIDLAIVRTGPVANGTWNLNSDGSWTSVASWTTVPVLDIPNGIGSNATFGTVISAPRTVSVDAVKTIGTMNFTSPQGYTISGTAGTTITFDNVATNNGIVVTAGNNTIAAPIQSQRDINVDVATGARLALTNLVNIASTGTGALGKAFTKTGGGTLQVTHIRNTVLFDGAATLAVNGGRLVVAPVGAGDTSGTSKVNGFTVASGAVVDLTNNALIIDYNTGTGVGTLLSDIKAMIVGGRLVTTATPPAGRDTRLGFRDNAVTTGMGLASATAFAGLSVDASSVLVKYTYGGDTNLDGIVDIKDLYNLALHYNAPGNWVDGDANYDGTVNVADLTILARNWQANGALGGGSSLTAALASLGLPDVAVPEPTSIGLVGLGLAGLMSRRRRRSK